MKNIVLALILACGVVACGTGDEKSDKGCSIVGSNNVQVCGDDNLVEQENSAADSSEAEILEFVWKPESESDGNLVVLINPVDATVIVTGDISETLLNAGASNGFGTTARGSAKGCDYGQGVIVEFFDSEGKPIKTGGGNLEITIPDGCNRYELN